MKILHFADIQIEARPGLLSNRFDEMRDGIDTFLALAKSEQPDIIVFAGDLFQYNTPNGNELLLASRLLTGCSNVTNTIVIPGNHDIKQRSNQLVIDGELNTEYDPIDALVRSVNRPSLVYVRHTSTVDAFGVRWFVWSQIDKHTKSKSYSPWDTDELVHLHAQSNDRVNIELFHDPIANYQDFDKDVANSSAPSMSSFRCKTVLAGDIHNPGIYKQDDCTFVYASSLIQRNFGEGDYWQNTTRTKSRNAKHGFYVHLLDHDVIRESRFVELPRTIERHTIELTKDFDYSMYKATLVLPSTSATKLVRLKVLSDFDKFRMHYDSLIEHLTSQHCQVIDVVYGNVEQSFELSNFELSSNQLSIDKLTELSHVYIRKLVKDSGISSSEQDIVEAKLVSVFDRCLTSIDTDATIHTIEFEQLIIDNFMSIDHIEIDFSNSGLYKIGGSNAVGKTTLTNALSWMVTDLISTEQSSANRKQNAFEYFNLFNEDRDDVGGLLKFKHNGDRYILRKSIVRQRDSKTNKIKDVKLTYSLSSYDTTLTEYADIAKFMSSILDVWTFHKFVAVNARKLESLLKVDHIDLQSRLMLMLGLRWIEDLKTKTLDQAKAMIFEGLIDNGLSTEQVLATISKDQASIVEFKNQQLVVDQSIRKLEIAIEQLEQVIANSRDSLSPIEMTIEDIDSKVQQHTSMLAKYDLALTKVSSLDKVSIEQNIKDTVTKLDGLRIAIEDNDRLLKDRQLESNKLESDLAIDQSNFLAKQSEIVFELDKQINEKRASINLKNEANTKKYIQLIDSKHSIEQELTSLLDTEAKIKDSFLQSFKTYKSFIANVQSKIDTIDQPCDVCHNTVSNERKIVLLKEYGDSIATTNEDLDKLKSNSSLSLKSITDLLVQKQKELESIDAEIKNSQNDHALNLLKLESELSALQTDRSKASSKQFESANIDKLSSLSIELSELNDRLNELKSEQLLATAQQSDLYKQLSIAEQADKQKTILTNDISSLKSLISDLERARLRIESNIHTQAKIEADSLILKQKRSELDSFRKQESSLEYAIIDCQKYILDSQTKLNQIRDWSIAKQTYTIYKKLVAKDGLRSFIFKSLIPWFNHEFGLLLANVPIRLLFDSDGRLYQENIATSRRTPVLFCSGMETTVLGLALLVLILRNCPRLKTNLIMIDEVTGQLNDGRQLSYAGLNYLKIFVSFIRKISKQHAIYLIDHMLDLDQFDRIYELRKDEQGSTLHVL